MVQGSRALLEETSDRRFCCPPELSNENLLELVTGSESSSYQRIQPKLTEEGLIPPPTMETDSKNASIFQETTHQRSHTGDTTVDNTVLVSYDLTDNMLATNCYENEQALDISLLEAIKQDHVGIGIDLDISSFLNQRIRKRTSQAYNHGWQKWMRWCVSQEPKVDSLACNPKNILRFFMDHQSYSIQQLKVYWAVFASVFPMLYPHMPPIASNVAFKTFFKQS
jgi:hypothetical protein